MAKAVMRLQWDQTSLVAMLLAEPNRNKDKHPDPYQPSDFHPYRTADEYKQPDDDEPDYAMFQQVAAGKKVTKLNGIKIHRSGESIYPAIR